MSAGNVFLGVLTGVAIGATLGVLFAPDKGSATRTKISQKSQGYVDDLSAKFDEIVKGLAEKIESVTDEATQLAKEGKHKVDEAASRTAARVGDGMR